MKVQEWEVRRARFSLKEENVYILQGNWPSGYEMAVFLDKEKIPAKVKTWEYRGALEALENTEAIQGEKVTVLLSLPETWEKYRHLAVFALSGEEKLLWYEASVKRLKEARRTPQFYLEEELVGDKNGSLYLRGWAADREQVKIGLFDQEKKKLPCRIRRSDRLDVQALYFETEIGKNCGFTIEAEAVSGKLAYLVLSGSRGKQIYPVNLNPAGILKHKMEKYMKRGMDYWRIHGMQALTARVARELFPPSEEETAVDYQVWIQRHVPGPGELERQRNTVLPRMPKFSLILPVKSMGERQLKQLLRNLENQTYRNFEVCLADETEDLKLHEVLHTFEKEEKRLHVTEQPEHSGIAEGVLSELKEAKGEYLLFCRQEDLPTPDALFSFAKEINEHPEGVLFYPDNDRMTPDGNRFFEPDFKPDFDPELLESTNYMGRFFLVKRDFFEKYGKVDADFSGACDYDLLLRLTEAAKREEIIHIPRILCHIRVEETSSTEEEEWEKARLALAAHYERLGEKAMVRKGEKPGLFQTRFVREESPLVSILIPYHGEKEALKRCLASLDRKSSYQNYEYLILTGEEGPEEGLTEKPLRLVFGGPQATKAVLFNEGVKQAKGSYLLFLDPDTELIGVDSLEEMLGCCMRKESGVVGARLYDGENRLSHAGVIIGLHGLAGNAFAGLPKTEEDVYNRILSRRGCSAVTGTCMLVKRSVFEEAGGFSEDFGLAFWDLDFCLRVGALGKRVIYEPYAEFYHYEDREKLQREAEERLEEFHQAIALFEGRWSDLIRRGDPFYNPNLTLEKEDFSLKRN